MDSFQIDGDEMLVEILLGLPKPRPWLARWF
jgi:hypothetical protein